MGLAASDLFLEFLVQASVIVEERGIRPGIAELLEDQTNLLVRERVPPARLVAPDQVRPLSFCCHPPEIRVRAVGLGSPI
jgi:hypothetical protein